MSSTASSPYTHTYIHTYIHTYVRTHRHPEVHEHDIEKRRIVLDKLDSLKSISCRLTCTPKTLQQPSCNLNFVYLRVFCVYTYTYNHIFGIRMYTYMFNTYMYTQTHICTAQALEKPSHRLIFLCIYVCVVYTYIYIHVITGRKIYICIHKCTYMERYHPCQVWINACTSVHVQVCLHTCKLRMLYVYAESSCTTKH